MGDAVIGDVVFDHLYAFGATQHLVLFAALHFAVPGGNLFQGAGIQAFADAAAGADISSKFLIVSHCINPPFQLRD